MKQTTLNITTDHPTSSYGQPVAIIDGQAYGPSDIYEGLPVASYAIVNIHPDKPELNGLIVRFCQADPAAHRRALAAINRLIQ